MNMEFFRKLPIPKEIKEMFPLTKEAEVAREYSVNEQKRILCSGHRLDEAILVGSRNPWRRNIHKEDF